MVTEKNAGSDPLQQLAWTNSQTQDDDEIVEHDQEHDPKAVNTSTTKSLPQKLIDVVTYIPPWCRYDPTQPPRFSIWYNVLFAFAGAFTVGNLYYNHPILNILARDFDVPYVKVSRIPTLMQAGYATGLLFVCPLGDLLRRRPLTLTLIAFTATLWIGLCLTHNFEVFCAISYITAITTVIPQVMLPLVTELAPPNRRALAISITTSGNLLGLVSARLLSGVVTNFTSWRNVYWIALALQYSILIVLWLFMPDYPSSNPDGLNYFKMIGGIILLYPKHAVLVQAGLISYCISSCFTSFWTTLTFLLADPPYDYTPITIGLFALIGIAGIVMGPFYAKYIIQPFAPAFSCIAGCLVLGVGVTLGTYSGTHTVVGPIIQAFALDASFQITQTANRAAIHSIEPKGRNRVNTAFMLFTFMGQMTGTSAGAELYSRGGWIASGSLSVGFVALALVLCVARGPYERGWIGWSGGWDIRKQNLAQATGGEQTVASVPGPPASVAVENEREGDSGKSAFDVETDVEKHGSRDDRGLDLKGDAR